VHPVSPWGKLVSTIAIIFSSFFLLTLSPLSLFTKHLSDILFSRPKVERKREMSTKRTSLSSKSVLEITARGEREPKASFIVLRLLPLGSSPYSYFSVSILDNMYNIPNIPLA